MVAGLTSKLNILQQSPQDFLPPEAPQPAALSWINGFLPAVTCEQPPNTAGLYFGTLSAGR